MLENVFTAVYRGILDVGTWDMLGQQVIPLLILTKKLFITYIYTAFRVIYNYVRKQYRLL